MTNFTNQDIVGACRGTLGFISILFAPGYVVASLCDLFRFRSRSFLERASWAVALSFAISPILVILLGWVTSLGTLAAVFAFVACLSVATLFAQRRSPGVHLNRLTVLLLLFGVVGIAVLVGSLVDIQQGNRLYLSVSVLDQQYRVAFTNGIFHTGIPPLNPLYRGGGAYPMRYYYFWYALCAVCMKLAHISARQALIASSCWAGIGLIAMISLYARHFLDVRDRLYRVILAGALLLTVTGLDILPVLYKLLVKHSFSGDLEWWSTDQISSWFDSIAWVPNHTSSLLCCLVAFLLIWQTRNAETGKDRVAAIILAGIAAASAFGLSIYVTAGFAMLMVGWAVVLLAERRETVLVTRLAGSVLVAGVLVLPYLRSLIGAHSGTQGGASAGATHLFQFGVRKMLGTHLIIELPILASINQSHPVLLEQLVRLMLLLPGYALELGVYGLVLVLGLAGWRRLELPDRTALGLSFAGLILIGFVRSAVIGNNDFGYRAALIPSFFLLLLAAEMLTRPKSSPWLGLLIFFGLAGTGFQVLMLRVYVPLHVAANMPGYAGLPEAAFAARSGYEAAAQVIPQTAVVQANLTDPQSYDSVLNMLYSERAMVTDATQDCGAVFGGNPGNCPATQEAVRSLFRSPAPSAAEAIASCHFLGIDYVAAAQNDQAWDDTKGWVWKLPVAGHAETGFRVVQCGTTPQTVP